MATAPDLTATLGGHREHPGAERIQGRFRVVSNGLSGRLASDKGVIGFDFGRRYGRSEPWFPEPR